MIKESHLHVFIGYDEKQPLAWEVCAHSLRRAASRPLTIYKLDHRHLREIGLFDREWTVEGTTGLLKDTKDTKPFSTQFAHSRFLVPEYCRYLGVNSEDAAIFVDSDFVFIDDPYKIVEEALEFPEQRAVYVVKHDYHPSGQTKMDNQVQTDYNMKLWSSLILFNLSHSSRPTRDQVNTESGRWLHTFEWLNGEHEIGDLSVRWNFIPEHNEEDLYPWELGAVHYTEGAPCIPGYENRRYAALFKMMEREVYEEKLKKQGDS